MAFNEQQYLQNNPDVAAAVRAGGFSSGQDHFSQFGHSENRTPMGAQPGSERINQFNEQTYIQNNPDVAAAVKSGQFNSGRHHFNLHGYGEDSRWGETNTTGTNTTGTNTTGTGNEATTPQIDYSGMFADLTGQVGSMRQDMGTGFNTTQQGVNTGFEGMNNQFTNLSGFVDSRTQQLNDNMNTGFVGMDGRFDEAAASQLDTRQQLLAGQAGINTLGGEIRNRQDTQFGSLTDGQANMTQRLGTVQTGVDDFRENYDRTSGIQGRQMADMSGTMQGGFNNTNRNIATAMASNVSGVPINQQQFNGTNQNYFNYAGTAQQIATGQAPTSPAMQQQQETFVSTVNSMKMSLMQNAANLDPQTRQAFYTVASGFDQSGKLIPQGVDQNGNRIARALDQNGNMASATFGPSGETLAHNVVNLNQILSMFSPVPIGGLVSPQ